MRQIFPENLSCNRRRSGTARTRHPPVAFHRGGRTRREPPGSQHKPGSTLRPQRAGRQRPAPPGAFRAGSGAGDQRRGERANGWCGRERATTRAPQPPNAARVRVPRRTPALSRPLGCQPTPTPSAPRWLGRVRRDGEHTIFTRQRVFLLLVFFCVSSHGLRRDTVSDRELLISVPFFLFRRDDMLLFFLRITNSRWA